MGHRMLNFFGDITYGDPASGGKQTAARPEYLPALTTAGVPECANIGAHHRAKTSWILLLADSLFFTISTIFHLRYARNIEK